MYTISKRSAQQLVSTGIIANYTHLIDSGVFKADDLVSDGYKPALYIPGQYGASGVIMVHPYRGAFVYFGRSSNLFILL